MRWTLVVLVGCAAAEQEPEPQCVPWALSQDSAARACDDVERCWSGTKREPTAVWYEVHRQDGEVSRHDCASPTDCADAYNAAGCEACARGTDEILGIEGC